MSWTVGHDEPGSNPSKALVLRPDELRQVDRLDRNPSSSTLLELPFHGQLDASPCQMNQSGTRVLPGVLHRKIEIPVVAQQFTCLYACASEPSDGYAVRFDVREVGRLALAV